MELTNTYHSLRRQNGDGIAQLEDDHWVHQQIESRVPSLNITLIRLAIFFDSGWKHFADRRR